MPVGTRDEAIRLTEAIREAVYGAEQAAEQAYQLLAAAKAQQVWEPMGYASFDVYVKTEFRVLRNTAWRRLTQALVSGEIAEAAKLDAPVILSQRQAMQLRPHLTLVKREIRDKSVGKTPRQRDAVVRHIVGRETRPAPRTSTPPGYKLCPYCEGTGYVPESMVVSAES